MRKLLVIVLLLASFLMSAQVGGRMRERKNQKRFQLHILKSGWKYHPTKPGKLQTHRREGRHLFFRSVTRNENFRNRYQAKINRDRARKRVRGNVVFSRRKY